MTRLRYSPRLLPLLSGLLTAAAFLDVRLSCLVFVGLLPFIFYARRAATLQWRQILLDCWLMGLIFSMLVLSWILLTEPGSWSALHGFMEPVVMFTAWFLNSLAYSLVFLLLGLYVFRCRRDAKRLLACLPLAWAALEILRAYLFSIYLWAPETTISPGWNMGSLGLAAAGTPLVFLSRFLGLYGLTAVIIVINLALYGLLVRRYKVALAALSGVVLLNLAAWKLYQPPSGSQPVKVSAVHLDKADSLYKWHKPAPPAGDTRLLVLPEYSEFFAKPDNNRAFLEKYVGQQTLIITSQHGSGHPPTNDLVYFTPQQGTLSRQAKKFLIPAGEYLPQLTRGVLKLLQQDKTLQVFAEQHQLQPGTEAIHPVKVGNLTVGGLVCSGVVDLNSYKVLTKQGAQILTNSASFTLLHKAGPALAQEQLLARFHAVANARPFVQSAASGETFIMSSDGEIIKSADGQSQLIEGSVQLQNRKTIYSWLPW